MEGFGSTAPSPPAPKIPRSSLGYELVKAAFVALFGVVITVILGKLAEYLIARLNNQPAADEPGAPATVPPPLLPPAPADPEEIDLELSPVTDKSHPV
jgi:hypothetical protein